MRQLNVLVGVHMLKDSACVEYLPDNVRDEFNGFCDSIPSDPCVALSYGRQPAGSAGIYTSTVMYLAEND